MSFGGLPEGVEMKRVIGMILTAGVLAAGVSLFGASAASADAGISTGVTGVTAGAGVRGPGVKLSPQCSGSRTQFEWAPFPIQYWLWVRASGKYFDGTLFSWYGPTVGWVSIQGQRQKCV